MSVEKVWSHYEGIIEIWEQSPITGLKLPPGPPLIRPRLVRGLTLNMIEESEDIREPGESPRNHQGHRELELIIEQFYQEKDEQFITAPLFGRLSTDVGPPQLEKQFLIELTLSNLREHAVDEFFEFKKVFVNVPRAISGGETESGVMDYSLSFRILEFS